VRTARKIMQGELHLPDYVFSRPEAATATSAAFPRKAITIIVPTRAGGGNDTMARIIAARLGPLLGQEVLVDARAGANGAVAGEYVAHAVPDGHTLMFGYIGTHAMNPALQKLGYDPVDDFEPVGLVGSSPTMMVAHPDLHVADVSALIARLKATPCSIDYASAGDGTPPHFAAELFQLNTGTSMANTTYDGAAPAIADTVGGRMQVMFPSLFTARPFLRSGQLRALAVAGPRRLGDLPGVPTLSEAGVDGVDVTQWYGLFAPAGTPPAVIEQLNRALNTVLADPAVIDHFESNGANVESGTPAALKAQVGSELARWQQVVALSGLAPQEQRLAALE
jgi:tripartite-type tricarboxylate transporter receptor subunit TctC